MSTPLQPRRLAIALLSKFSAAISRTSKKLKTRGSKNPWLIVPAITAISVASLVAFSAGTPPNIPAVTLSADPLYAPSTTDKPALALALSVEYPTVGAQYVDPDNNGTSDDPTYSPSIEYLGYYDAESCYTYDKAGSGAPVGKESDYKRFVRRGPALPLATPNTTNPTWTTRMCWSGSKSYSKDDGTSPAFSTTTNDGFSGNFLNWASNSAIDMLRLSLTGGDRVIDTTALTVLQRAIIPDGNPISMGNSNNFPSKRLYRSGTSRAIVSASSASPAYTSGVPYFGAVPTAMATAAGTNDIYVANTLNRIYFGTSKSGNNSSNFGSYTLGVATNAAQMGTITNSSTALPGGSTVCAAENATCTLPAGTWEVRYGANTSWKVVPATGSVACTNALFGDPITGTPKNCYYRAYTGSWTPTVSPAAFNDDGYFFARVQVCDRDPSTYALKDNRYWALCSRYSDGASSNPTAIYKPTGAVQKYSDSLRLAAFGYLMDPQTSRYGGVLRAPIKFVGSKTFDINGLDNTPSTGNPNKEWDPITGVFITNPDSNTTIQTSNGSGSYLSGVVSYLNQFGRTGAIAGRYKTYDPIGELHYQAVRYFQGLQPTDAAVTGITTDMYDGYPVYTNWSDPYGNGRTSTADYSCLKSNIVVIGDKNAWDYNSRLPSASAANNVPDIAYWQGITTKFESKTAGSYIDGTGGTSTIYNPNTANTSGVGSASGDVSLVGSAYWAHTHDIRGTDWTKASTTYTTGTALQRPGLRVKTFVFDVNEFGGSNDANTRRTTNQLFRAAKYGGFEADPSNTSKNPYNTKGNPFVNEQNGTDNNYVWQDTDPSASRVGEANTYFLQSNARAVLSAFDDIFARASTAARSIAGGAIQSKNLTQAGDTIYQGSFDTADWSGDLLAIPVTVAAGTNVVSISSGNAWTAASRLATLPSPATSRNIVIGKSGAASTPTAIPFTWAQVSGTSIETELNRMGPAYSADGYGQDRLNYLRGDASKEGILFRKRGKLLGDIINSGVVYSGAPSSSISSSGYGAFFTAKKNRTPAVFVGANDGMLHAFNATTGDEMFGFIPSWMTPKLSALTTTTYNSSHQSYVDGTPAVAEAEVDSVGWKTVLISGTGAGGQGVFALDVSDPSTFSASNVMWEFTHTDDADMGNVIGRPQILKMRTSASGSPATYKWFAVVASGVNNYMSDANGKFSITGNPALFLLDLSKTAGSAWAEGTNYYKIVLPVDSTLSATKATGVINFRAALGSAREVTQIFMGDLHGNLWKLDFSLLGTTDWNLNKLSFYNKGTTADPIPMFIAKDSLGNIQPISAAPTIIFGPTPDSAYISFGTGKYLETGDKTNAAIQSEYLIYDNANKTLDTTPASAATSAISDRRRLKACTATVLTGIVSCPTFTFGRATSNLDTEAIRSGWRFDLPASKERQISSGTVFGDNIVFGSLIPGTSAAVGSCSGSGGGGNQWTINYLTGNGTFVASSVGILGEPLVAEISSATTYTSTDSTGRRTKTVKSQIFQQGSDGISVGRTETKSVISGRLTWRKINNYQDLKSNTP